MIFDKEDNTTIVFQENASLQTFVNNLSAAYKRISGDHIIVNLFSFSRLKAGDLLEFLQLSNTHRNAGKSFVLVTDKVSYTEVPDELCVVPSLREAKDIIDMEEMERDLEL